MLPTRVLVAWLVGLVALSIWGCQGPNPITNPSCPTAPTAWTIGSGGSQVVLKPSDYPVAARAPKTSIDVLLSQTYLRETMKSRLEAPPADNPDPDSGVFVDKVSIVQQGAGAQEVNLADVTITPWLKGANGVHARWTYSYLLRLKIVPYLVTPATVPDEKKRRDLLTSTDRGAVLRFDLFELHGHGELTSCSSPNFNFVDAKVLTAVYQALSHEEPLRLPTGALTTIANTMLGVTDTNLTGLNVGSDGGLKIGFLLDRGSPSAFDSSVTFGHLLAPDWAVMIDKSFVTAAIVKKVTDRVTQMPDATLNSTSIAFNQDLSPGEGSITVTANGTLNKCGGINFTATVEVTPLVRRRSDGSAVVFAPTTQKTTNSANFGQGICILLDQIFSSIANPLGLANATVNLAGQCVNPMGDPVQFSVNPGDQFYATEIDTDNVFVVAGRSTFLDGVLGSDPSGRPPVASCP